MKTMKTLAVSALFLMAGSAGLAQFNRAWWFLFGIAMIFLLVREGFNE